MNNTSSCIPVSLLYLKAFDYQFDFTFNYNLGCRCWERLRSQYNSVYNIDKDINTTIELSTDRINWNDESIKS